MFRRWIEITLWRSVTVAFAIFSLLFALNLPVGLFAQGRITVTPAPVKDASTEEIGGATIQNLSPALAEELDFSPNMPGIVVMDVNPSSPAGKSGLLPGDVIMAVNYTPVQTVSELKDTIWWMGLTPVTFSVVRGGADYIFTFPVW